MTSDDSTAELRHIEARITLRLMTNSRLPKIIAVAAALYVFLSLLMGVFVAEATLHPVRRPLTDSEVAQEVVNVKSESATLADATVTASDGIILNAWDITPDKPNGDNVILLHGLSDNRLGMEGYADLLLRHGYSVLLPDARAHGASGGTLATYGLREKDDIHRWFNWLVAVHHSRCIYGFGESMGAAQLLQGLAAESRFCAVAGECPFSSFREIAYDRMGQHFNAGPWIGRTLLRPVVESAFFYSRWKYGLNFEVASPEKSVPKSEVPVFLIHGQNDTNIPIRHSRRIAARNIKVVLWEVSNAGHTGAISVSPQEFENNLTTWFKDHSTP